jgi:hypothetical protein
MFDPNCRRGSLISMGVKRSRLGSPVHENLDIGLSTGWHVMQLVVYIPCPADTDHVRALSWARQAPYYVTERIDDQEFATAIFPSLPHGIETALHLVGECVPLSRAWASINGRTVSSLIRLWQRLDCYRGSLGVDDPLRYCRDKSAFFNLLVDCRAHRCPVACQFICIPCMKMQQEDPTLLAIDRFKSAAALAEIDWCPRLHLPAEGDPQ